MQKKLVAFILLFFSIGSFAQIPVLTATINPETGDRQLIHFTDTFNYNFALITGAGLTWHFDTLHSYETDTTFFSGCAASPYCADFPGSNVYVHYSDDESVSTYYNNSSAAMSFTGEYNTVPIYYSDNEDLLRFPFSYDSAYDDDFYSVFTTTDGYTYRRRGSINVRGRGYGTLILPGATYTNALAVYSSETFTDSTEVSGVPFAYNYTTNSVAWYAPGVRGELLNLTRYFRNGSLIRVSSYYATPPATAVSSINAAEVDKVLYPDPAGDQINIRINHIPGPGSWIAIYNTNGQQMARYSLAGTNTVVPVSQLPCGVYFCMIYDAGRDSEVKRFVVGR